MVQDSRVNAQSPLSDELGYDDLRDDEAGIDLGLLVRPAFDHFRIILAAALLAGAAGYGITFALTPRYTSHTDRKSVV